MSRSGGMTRRRFLELSAGGAVLLGLGAAGCTSGEQESAATEATGGAAGGDGTGGGVLRLFTWAEYENPENLTAFTERTGIEVEVETFGSNEEAIARIQEEGTDAFDLVVPTGSFVPLMADLGLLQELDKSRLPNLGNIDPGYADQPWDPGNTYSVVKAWGSTGYLYDTTVIGEELTDWAGFFRAAALPEVSGRVTALPEPSTVLGLVLWRDGIDYNTTDEAQLQRVEEILTADLLPHLAAWDDYPIEGLLEGEYALCQAYSGDARNAILEFPERYRYVFGAPVADLWVDNWALLADAPNPEAAYAFVDYMLRPNVSARELSYHGYGTGVLGVEEFLPVDLQASDMIFFQEERLENLVAFEVNESQDLREEIFDRLVAASGLEAG